MFLVLVEQGGVALIFMGNEAPNPADCLTTIMQSQQHVTVMKADRAAVRVAMAAAFPGIAGLWLEQTVPTSPPTTRFYEEGCSIVSRE